MMIESQEMDDVAEKERAILSAGGSSGVQGPRKLQLQIARRDFECLPKGGRELHAEAKTIFIFQRRRIRKEVEKASSVLLEAGLNTIRDGY